MDLITPEYAVLPIKGVKRGKGVTVLFCYELLLLHYCTVHVPSWCIMMFCALVDLCAKISETTTEYAGYERYLAIVAKIIILMTTIIILFSCHVLYLYTNPPVQSYQILLPLIQVVVLTIRLLAQLISHKP